jgi:3'-5' exoribonuclease 1
VLPAFCTELTGITHVLKYLVWHDQAQVDSAPHFPAIPKSFARFLAKNGLIVPETGKCLVRFCWCNDGPFDLHDFAVKQCFISKVGVFGFRVAA